MARRIADPTVRGLAAWWILCCAIPLPAADKVARNPAGNRVAGIVIDKQDGWISIKGDGDKEPTKYHTGKADERLIESLKGIFSVSRVQLTFEPDGEDRRLASIKRLVPKANGIITGEVVQNHGWWVELKPRTGTADGYACQFPFDDHAENPVQHRFRTAPHPRAQGQLASGYNTGALMEARTRAHVRSARP